MNPMPAQKRPSPSRRTVELLAATSYRIIRQTADYVVLGAGKQLELWRKVDVPHKGYAIRLDAFEYEFESTVPE